MTPAASHFAESECARSATSCVLEDAAFMVLHDEKHRRQALRISHNTKYVTLFEAPLLTQCVTQHNRGPIAETEVLTLCNLANKETSIVRRVSMFVPIKMSLINFIAAFEKEHGVFFFAAG